MSKGDRHYLNYQWVREDCVSQQLQHCKREKSKDEEAQTTFCFDSGYAQCGGLKENAPTK